MKAKLIVEKLYALEDEDTAFNYVEDEIGHFYFCDNWKKHRDLYSERLRVWLAENGDLARYDAIVQLLDDLADKKIQWTDFDQDTFDVSKDIARIVKKEAKEKARHGAS